MREVDGRVEVESEERIAADDEGQPSRQGECHVAAEGTRTVGEREACGCRDGDDVGAVVVGIRYVQFSSFTVPGTFTRSR